MQTRSSYENSVRLSVCPSLCLSARQTRALWQNGRKICLYLYTIRTIVFWEEAWLVGANPSTWNFGSTVPRCSDIADFDPIIASSTLAVTPSEKVQLTTIESPIRAFQWAWSSYVAPKTCKGGSNRKTAIFRLKSHVTWRKSACYKVYLCENCQRQSCKAFIGLTIRAKMFGEGRPLVDRVGAKSPIFDVFARSNSAVSNT